MRCKSKVLDSRYTVHLILFYRILDADPSLTSSRKLGRLISENLNFVHIVIPQVSKKVYTNKIYNYKIQQNI